MSLVFHDVTKRAQYLLTDSMIPAAQVQAMATIKTARVKANCAAVPQIPSGRANDKARPTAMPPAWAVEIRRALKSAQHGPIINRPIKMTLDPRSASAAVISNMMATLKLQNKRCVLSVTTVNFALDEVVLAPRVCEFHGPAR